MRSPFPGMDPYLEKRWSDVHVDLITSIRAALQPKLPSSLRARAEERVLLETVEEQPLGSYRSDVTIVETDPADRFPTTTDGAVATAEPVVVQVYAGPEVERFVQIIDSTAGNGVITAIEVLIDRTKEAGVWNAAYLRRLEEYQRREVSIVQIDLLHYPQRAHLPITEFHLPRHHRTPYLVCIRRAWQSDRWLAYTLSLRQPLPSIPIPLRKADKEVTLELQPLIDHAYVAGGHDDIDYSKPLDPPLMPSDAKWADELLRAAGRRK